MTGTENEGIVKIEVASNCINTNVVRNNMTPFKLLMFSLVLLLLFSCKTDNRKLGNGECDFEDGKYSSTVDYTNQETGYSQTYNLDVEVEDCKVIQINFPNGGWLDSDHINPSEIGEGGSCIIEGEEGKTYAIQIDK